MDKAPSKPLFRVDLSFPLHSDAMVTWVIATDLVPLKVMHPITVKPVVRLRAT